jgi:hypothetical protein
MGLGKKLVLVVLGCHLEVEFCGHRSFLSGLR